jgi:hypothetical protein
MEKCAMSKAPNQEPPREWRISRWAKQLMPLAELFAKIATGVGALLALLKGAGHG